MLSPVPFRLCSPLNLFSSSFSSRGRRWERALPPAQRLPGRCERKGRENPLTGVFSRRRLAKKRTRIARRKQLPRCQSPERKEKSSCIRDLSMSPIDFRSGMRQDIDWVRRRRENATRRRWLNSANETYKKAQRCNPDSTRKQREVRLREN